MPKWVVICPNCKRPHTYAEVEAAKLDTARRDPIRTVTRPTVVPDGERQKCSLCNKEMKIKNCDLTYSYL